MIVEAVWGAPAGEIHQAHTHTHIHLARPPPPIVSPILTATTPATAPPSFLRLLVPGPVRHLHRRRRRRRVRHANLLHGRLLRLRAALLRLLAGRGLLPGVRGPLHRCPVQLRVPAPDRVRMVLPGRRAVRPGRQLRGLPVLGPVLLGVHHCPDLRRAGRPGQVKGGRRGREGGEGGDWLTGRAEQERETGCPLSLSFSLSPSPVEGPVAGRVARGCGRDGIDMGCGDGEEEEGGGRPGRAARLRARVATAASLPVFFVVRVGGGACFDMGVGCVHARAPPVRGRES